MEFTLEALWSATGTPVRVVIVIMALMALACVYVTIERLIALGKARSQSRNLAAAITESMAKGNAAAALDVARAKIYKDAYLARLMEAGLAEFSAREDKHGIEAAFRGLERVSIIEGADLRRGLNILATVGSTAPFVGLVGTIFGIINAFEGMAESGSGGLGAVSAGIAEALVTTAIGISVAIIGVWMFNYFTARIDGITDDINVAIQEFIDWCEKQVLASGETDTEETAAGA